MNTYFSKTELESLFNLFNEGYSISSLAQLKKCDSTTLKQKLESEGFKIEYKDSRRLNSSYFAEINTEDKAYLLGLFASDGSMITRYNGKRKIISFNFTKSDIELLYMIQKYISPKSTIYNIPEKKIGNYVYKPKVMIQINSFELFDDLLNLNFTPNKTYTNFKFPNIPKELYPHFIRGYFDGDGSISESSRNTRAFTITSLNETILKDIQVILTDIGIKTGVYKTSKNCYTLQCANKAGIIDIYNYMYNNSTLYLNRKKEKYELIMATLT